MFSFFRSHSVLNLLPSVRGRLQENAPLRNLNRFCAGGSAEVLFEPEDEKDLCHFLENRPGNMPLTILGAGSNVLIRDGGVPGIVVLIGKNFDFLETDGDEISCGAGVMDAALAKEAAKQGLTGFEFLAGIPGRIGGALRMNAGAMGQEIKDILVSADLIDSLGHKHTLTNEEMGFAYRRSLAPNGAIFTRARFKGTPEKEEKIEKTMAALLDKRRESQPYTQKTGGSTFKNPLGLTAWKLIDKAGCRGLKVGNAIVSEQHCNFLINLGGATSADIENLGEEVRKRVLNNSGVKLEWEIRRIGVRSHHDQTRGA